MSTKVEVIQPDGSTEFTDDDVAVAERQEGPEVEQKAPEVEQEAPAEEQQEDEVIVKIGDEEPDEQEQQEKAPDWLRELRNQHRELLRKVKEYEAKERTAPQAEALKPLPAKPKLEDHDYDTDRYEAALEVWYKKREEHAQFEAKQRQLAEEQEQAWKSKLDAYGKAKSSLKVRDFDDAEEVAQQVLSVVQQGVVLQGADDPAVVVYALGKNPKKAKELAAITDPVKFAFAVAKLEKELKVIPRKSAPSPERVVQTTGPKSGTVDSALDRLRAEAEKTGDYTKVVQYKRQKQSARS